MRRAERFGLLLLACATVAIFMPQFGVVGWVGAFLAAFVCGMALRAVHEEQE